jgi:hypothetical protein
MPAMKGFVRRAALAVAWVLIVALLSLGAAGIVGTMAHQPGTAARAELTFAGDRAIEPGLDAAEAGLNDLSAEVTELSDAGRAALAALTTGDVATLETSVDAGGRLALAVQAHAAELRRDLEALPGFGPDAEPELTFSPETRRRHALALAALSTTDGIAADWSGLSSSALAATRMTVLLTDHDLATAAAAEAGRAGKYADALEKLTESDAMIAEARGLRDALAASVDVTTLTQWLDLNAAYDGALRTLYEAIVAAKGKVTDAVKDAFAAEKEARNHLPPDTRALVVILSDIGRGGLNQAVIGIEGARGELEAAIELLTAEPSPSP